MPRPHRNQAMETTLCQGPFSSFWKMVIAVLIRAKHRGPRPERPRPGGTQRRKTGTYDIGGKGT